MEYSTHHSVLLNECLENLLRSDLPEGALIADLTFGGGGHSQALLKSNKNIKLIGVDQDPEALANGQKIAENLDFKGRLELWDCNFEEFTKIFKERYPGQMLCGVLADIGVSSHHFDSADRGFSFRFDGPLDMRMNPRADIPTAADLLNSLSEKEIVDILDKYGEEKFSGRIARAICEFRDEKDFSQTKELENLVFHSYPKKMRFGHAHPATRTFQAFRIAVNRELEVLENLIDEVCEVLDEGGRLAIISFHSLEDRIVKTKFKEKSMGEGYRLLYKKPVLPSSEELEINPRSRSAKLRVLEKI